MHHFETAYLLPSHRFSFLGAYCYAELGCMIKKSGADYAYIHFAFGPFLAFIRLWIECVILRPCIGAIQSLTFALYILKPFFPECDPPENSTKILAAACICLLCFINCYSVKWASMVGTHTHANYVGQRQNQQSAPFLGARLFHIR